jgi:hypothetical protein
MKILLVLSLLLLIISTQITLPIKHHFSNIHPQKSHLKHLYETYSLRSRRSTFTLNIIVNGLPYEPTMDTGSSDFFIKGVGTRGEPESKIDCQQCLN